MRRRQSRQQGHPHRRAERLGVQRDQRWLRRVPGRQHMCGAEGRLDVGLLNGHRRQRDRLVVEPAVLRACCVGLEPRWTCRHGPTMARNAARSPAACARTGGSGPVNFCTCTSTWAPVQPRASDDVPTSSVKTLGLPCTHIASGSAGSAGSNQAPVDNCTTSGRRLPSTTTPARQAPRSLKIRTTSPSTSSRAAASVGASESVRALALSKPGWSRRRRAGCAAGTPAGWRAGAADIAPRGPRPAIPRVRTISGARRSRRSRILDVGREDLDATARGGKPVSLGVGPEVGQQRQPGLGGQPQPTLPPELPERGHVEIESGGPFFVHVHQPLPGGAPVGELFPKPSRSASAAMSCSHRGTAQTAPSAPASPPAAGRCANRSSRPFERGGRWHDDVGVLGHCRPVRVVHHDGVHAGQCPSKRGMF